MHFKLKSALAIGLVSLASLTLFSSVRTASTHASTINQRTNALKSYIPYRKLHYVRNARVVEPNDYSHHYNHQSNYDREFRTVGGNTRVTFRPYGTLPDNYNRQSSYRANAHNPQSLVISKDGMAYVSYRTSQQGVQIVRFKLRNLRNAHHMWYHGWHFVSGQRNVHYKTGPVFNGGHGQAMAYNPKSNQLWLLTNDNGSAFHTSLLQISKKTLRPVQRINFHFNPYPMPDVLTFDNHGNAYTAMRTFSQNNQGSLKLFKGRITNHSVKFHMVKGLRYAPGTVMQNMCYNPSNHRIYFITDGELMSVPARHFSHLKPREVRTTQLSGHYEFEDLAFHHGKGYLMVHYPSELLVSDHDF